SDVDMALRTAAAGALGTIGADSPAALDALAVALTMPGEFLIESMPSDGREDLRSSAWTALERIGASHADAVARAVVARLGHDERALYAACTNHPDPRIVAPAVVSVVKRELEAGLIAACLGERRSLAAAALPTL